MLDLCLLGTGGMMPLPYRWLTSLMLRCNGSSLLIDCGEGTQPLQYWNRLQKGETIEDGGTVYTPDMVLGPARKGIKVTYTTDTRPTESIVENARGSDLLICEGMYGEKAMSIMRANTST